METGVRWERGPERTLLGVDLRVLIRIQRGWKVDVWDVEVSGEECELICWRRRSRDATPRLMRARVSSEVRRALCLEMVS